MIVVKLMGGLGNQLFQYAFAKQLALQHKVALKLDVSALTIPPTRNEFTNRDLALTAFAIKADIASKAEVEKFQKSRLQKLLDYASLYLPVKAKHFYLREPYFNFFSQAINAPDNTYIDGYWQSEQYFLTIREQLLADFTLIKPLSQKSVTLAADIQQQQSVSIHVRRGDYVTEQNSKLYATCNETYYYAAIKAIKRTYSQPTLYVFSDEPEWFNKNIKTDLPVIIVAHNQEQRAYEDLYLMSLCKHNIIANSSFSWWGAWLNQHQDKQVIAPEKWFKDNSKKTTDLLPKAWMRL